MNRLKTRKLYLFLAFALLAARPALASTAADFEDEEYYGSGGLAVINAAGAYAKGYTGAGVTLGIIDNGVNGEHSEFSGRDFSWYPCTGYVYDWEENDHGTHVAGIMAANRDGVGMHGVAFNAGIAAFGADFNSPTPISELITQLLSLPGVRIINNSWGSNRHLLDEAFYLEYMSDVVEIKSEEGLSGEEAIAALENEWTEIINEEYDELQADKLLEQGKVMVFSASNEGTFGPESHASLRAFLPELNNWISVAALNSAGISIGDDGSKALTPSSVAMYSCLALGAESYTICAPGTDIYSAYAADVDSYFYLSGTSMAAPYVTGALGLVQEAYPWMSARLYVDTVLSTADRDFEAPEYVISISELDDDAYEICFQYVDAGDGFVDRTRSSAEKPSRDSEDGQKIAACLSEYYEENSSLLSGKYGIKSAEDFVNAFFASEEEPDQYSAYKSAYGTVWSVPIDQIFGQGILDVGKAVDGLAVLDANRMAPDDIAGEEIQSYTGKAELLYPIDTQGYTAYFNNDISQELWHSARHTYIMDGEDYSVMEDQETVGLLKSGEGTLYLTGTNTYEGSTVIEGGAISVSVQSDGSGGELTASDVYVLEDGTLQGDGTILRNVYNWGTVSPGNDGIGTLTVGSYTSCGSGVLSLQFTQDGENDVLAVSGSASAGTLSLTPQGWFDGSTRTWDLSDLVSASDVSVGSYVTSAALDITGDDTTVEISHPDDGFSRNSMTPGASAAGSALDSAMAGAQGDQQDLYSALLSLDSDGLGAALDALHGEVYDVLSLAALNRSRMLTGMVESRLFSCNPLPKGWNWFAMPFGSVSRQDGWDSYGSYKSHTSGVMVGSETRRGDWTVGVHGGFVHEETSVSGGSFLSADSDGGFVGIHGKKAKDPDEGFFLFGQARLAWDSYDANRTVVFEGWSAKHSSGWTGFTGSAQVGAGWNRKVRNMTLTPLVALDYAYLRRPGFSEDGTASRLSLDGSDFQSLRSSLGVRAAFARGKGADGLRWDASVSALWRHEFLDDLDTGWTFLGVRSGTSWRDSPARDWLDLTAGVSFSATERFAGVVEVGTSVFRSGYDDFRGSLRLEWTF